MFAVFGDNISEDNMITNIISIIDNPSLKKDTNLQSEKVQFLIKRSLLPKFSTLKVKPLQELYPNFQFTAKIIHDVVQRNVRKYVIKYFHHIFHPTRHPSSQHISKQFHLKILNLKQVDSTHNDKTVP